jgi:hypothetical protein
MSVTDSRVKCAARFPFAADSRNALVLMTSRPSPALKCSDCERPIPPGTVALFWSNCTLDEPSCPRCVAVDLVSRGRDLDGWFWEPWTCEVCHRPVRGRSRTKAKVCSPECSAGLRAVRRARARASSWELDCRRCDKRITGTVCYGAYGAPSPLCESCYAAIVTAYDQDSLERYGRDGVFGLNRGKPCPGDPDYDPLDPRTRVDCPVCGRGVRGRRVCCDQCDSHSDNVVRRVKHDQRACEYCGEMFTPKRADARFCKTAHRVAAHRAQRAVTANRDEKGRVAPTATESRNSEESQTS